MKKAPRAKAARRSPAKRVRRTGEEARASILDAAEAQLLAKGPDGLRLQQVAKAAGVSHPAVLHHFKSRAGLVREVVHRSLEGLRSEIVASLRGGEALDPVDLLGRAFRTLSTNGYARLSVWLVLSGEAPTEDETWVRDIALAAHARRPARDDARRSRGANGTDAIEETAALEDTLFHTMLAALVVFGDAIMGPSLRTSAGLDETSATRRRFDAWLGRQLTAWLSRPPG